MEGGVNSLVKRQLELVNYRIDLVGDGEGANVSGTKLLAGQAYLWLTAKPSDPVGRMEL